MRTRLIKVRKQRNLSQREVAEKLGISRAFYGMIETGARNPTLELAQRIAEFFSETIDTLFFSLSSNEMLQNPKPTGTDGGDHL